LTGDPDPKRCSDPAVQPADLLPRQAAGGSEGMDLRPPERFVRIDVPQSGCSALVEDRGLDRRAAALEPCCERRGREALAERLLTEPLQEIWSFFVTLQKHPRSKAANVTVRDVRSVV
jgi:hypothetical protein